MSPRSVLVRSVLAACLIAASAIGAQPAWAWAHTAYIKIEQRLTPAQMHETGLDALSAEQLARLNDILQGEVVTAQAESATREVPQRGAASYIGMDTAPITTRLKGSISSWEPGTVFELENGQVWKVLKGNMKLRKPLDAPVIVLVPGIAGRWFLQVDEDLPKARVYRID
jgi:hypothetical protein